MLEKYKHVKSDNAMLAKIAYRNVWRNKRRTLFCLAAVGIAVFFIILYSAMIDGMIGGIRSLVQVFDLGHVRVVSTQYEAENEYMPVQYPVADGRSWRELADSIKGVPGVRKVLPRIATMATLQESVVKHAVLWGLNIEDEVSTNTLNFTNRSDGLIEGRYPAPDANECAVGRAFAQKSGLKVGDNVPLKVVSAQLSDKIWSPKITGIFNFDYVRFDERYIIVDFGRLQRLLVMGDGTQQIVVYADDEKQSAAIATDVQKIVGGGNEVSQWRDNYWVAVMESVTPLYFTIFMIFLIVASLLIINTVVMIIHERIKEIGMMGCLGMTRPEIVKVFFFESLFLSALGAFAGVLVGGLLTGILSHFPIRMGDLYGNTFSEMPLSSAIFMHFSPARIAMAWAMGVVVASLFTLLPSLKSAFVEPVEALRR